MKRTPELRTLSEDHHHGLAHARRLRRAAEGDGGRRGPSGGGYGKGIPRILAERHRRTPSRLRTDPDLGFRLCWVTAVGSRSYRYPASVSPNHRPRCRPGPARDRRRSPLSEPMVPLLGRSVWPLVVRRLL